MLRKPKLHEILRDKKLSNNSKIIIAPGKDNIQGGLVKNSGSQMENNSMN